MVHTLKVTRSQQALLEAIADPDCVQYLSVEGLEIHDVAATALLGRVASILYPREEVQNLLAAGLIHLVEDDVLSDRAYYEQVI